MTKKEFIRAMSERMSVPEYLISSVYSETADFVGNNLLDERVIEIPYLGSFVLNDRKATTYKNLFGVGEKTVSDMVCTTFKVCSSIKNKVKMLKVQ